MRHLQYTDSSLKVSNFYNLLCDVHNTFLYIFYLKIDIVRNLFSMECHLSYVKNGLNNVLLFLKYTLKEYF